MRLLWVAVFHYSSECTAIILVVGWRAACWSHLREGPAACQRSWSLWEGNNVYCYIFCILSLYLLICSFIPLYLCITSFIGPSAFSSINFLYVLVFKVFHCSLVNTFLNQPYTVVYWWAPSISLTLSFSGRKSSFPRYCMSFATSLCQSDQ